MEDYKQNFEDIVEVYVHQTREYLKKVDEVIELKEKLRSAKEVIEFYSNVEDMIKYDDKFGVQELGNVGMWNVRSENPVGTKARQWLGENK